MLRRSRHFVALGFISYTLGTIQLIFDQLSSSLFELRQCPLRGRLVSFLLLINPSCFAGAATSWLLDLFRIRSVETKCPLRGRLVSFLAIYIEKARPSFQKGEHTLALPPNVPVKLTLYSLASIYQYSKVCIGTSRQSLLRNDMHFGLLLQDVFP